MYVILVSNQELLYLSTSEHLEVYFHLDNGVQEFGERRKPGIACKSQRRAFLRMNDISFTGFKMNMEIIQILRELSVHLENSSEQ